MSYHGHFEQQKPKKKRGVKIFLIILAVLAIIGIGVAAFGYSTYRSMLGKITIVTMPTEYEESEATEEPTSTTSGAEATETTVEEPTTETTIPAMKPEDIVNILLVGQAGRAGETAAMADTMILVSINKYTDEVTLTSFLRDTYVDLPDYRDSNGRLRTCGWNKLTTCYALGYSFGGTGYAMGMTNQCLKDNFGVEVDYNIEISFDSFIKVVDLLYGVTVQLTEAEAEYLNNDFYIAQEFQAGWAHLDGTDALSYARMRKAAGDNDSDIKRTSRQRYLLEMLLLRVKEQSLSDIQRIANEVLPMITTNMPADKITELLLEVIPMLSDLKLNSGTCPIEGLYWNEYKDTPDGYLPVLVFDRGQITNLMRVITEGETKK